LLTQYVLCLCLQRIGIFFDVDSLFIFSDVLFNFRVEGETNPEIVLARLHQAVADNEAYLIAERQERHERSMTQTLRQQQDVAYMESLKADQEKEKRKKEELEKKLLEEQKQQQLVENEKRKKEVKIQSII